MKNRIKAFCGIMLAAAVCAALTSCAFRKAPKDALAAPGIQPAAGRMLLRLEGADTIPAPDIYWMYGDNFSQLITDSQLIILGRVKSSSEQEAFLSIESDSAREVIRERITVFDVEPLQTVKGFEKELPPMIRVASYANIAYSTLDMNTLQQAERGGEALDIPADTALFFLKRVGDSGVYFPVNITQGIIELTDGKLFPKDGNDVITPGAELADFIDSAEAVMNFKDEPTNASYRRFSVAG